MHLDFVKSILNKIRMSLQNRFLFELCEFVKSTCGFYKIQILHSPARSRIQLNESCFS